MQASNVPSKSAVPFATSGTKNTIPVASQIGVTPGLASFTDGFPPLTMTPLAAGGVPPYGADFNGILNFLSSAVRWAQAGAGYGYDAAFSAAVGGYPKGAILLNAAGTGFWLSTVDNNTTNPDASGAGWSPVINNVASTTAAGIVRIATTVEAQGWTNDAVALTPLKLGDAFKGGNQTLTNQGIQKFPGGLILQWGETNITNTGNINFPTAFPNAVLNVKANAMSAVDSTTTSSCFVEMAIRSAGQIWVKLIQADGALGSRGVQWLALGW